MSVQELLSVVSSGWLPFAAELMWKSTLILGVAGLATRVLVRRTAAARHLVWTLGFAGVLVTPAVSLFTPSWRVGVLPSARVAEGVTPVRAEASASAARPIERLESTVPLTSNSVKSVPEPVRPPWSLPLFLFGVWLIGAILIEARMVAGVTGVMRLARRCAVMPDAEWHAIVAEIRSRLQIVRKVGLLQSAANVTPMTIGLFRSAIVLPAGAEAWSTGRKRVVALHELAHVSRRDVLVQLFAQFACAVYWFHPLVWYAARRLRIERERACDDTVVSAGERPSEYATHLLEVARNYGLAPRLQPAALAMARPSQLEHRLLAVLAPGLRCLRLSRPCIRVSTLAAFGVVIPLGVVTPVRWRPIDERVPPASSQSGNVVIHPDTTAPLAERWSWAFGQARQRPDHARRGFWIAYSIVRVARPGEAFVSGRAGFNLEELDRQPLQTQLFGTRPDRYDQARADVRVPRQVALMFRFEPGATSLARAADARIHSLHVGIALDGLPVHWLGTATDAQSIAWLEREYDRTTVDWLLAELIDAVGVHQTAGLAVPFLRKVLQNESNPRLRAEAAEALGDQNSAEAFHMLMETVRTDPSPEVRREAAEALGQTRSADATAILFEIARTSTDAEVRREATEALSEQATAAAAEVLTKLALEAGDLDVQREAAESLGDLPGALGLDGLGLVMRSHERWEIRAEAAEALAEKPAERALPLLAEVIFGDRDHRVQEDAVEAAADFGRAAESLLQRIVRDHPDPEIREKAREGLEDIRQVKSPSPSPSPSG